MRNWWVETALWSERQVRIACLVSNGFDNKRISTILNLSVSTVKKHLTKLYKLTRTKNRIELAIKVRAGHLLGSDR